MLQKLTKVALATLLAGSLMLSGCASGEKEARGEQLTGDQSHPRHASGIDAQVPGEEIPE